MYTIVGDKSYSISISRLHLQNTLGLSAAKTRLRIGSAEGVQGTSHLRQLIYACITDYTVRCLRLLFCLFQICDVDNDGILSDQELNDFQVVMCVPWWIYRYIIYMYMYIHVYTREHKGKGEKV